MPLPQVPEQPLAVVAAVSLTVPPEASTQVAPTTGPLTAPRPVQALQVFPPSPAVAVSPEAAISSVDFHRASWRELAGAA